MAQINASDVQYLSLRGNKLPDDREIAQLVKGKWCFRIFLPLASLLMHNRHIFNAYSRHIVRKPSNNSPRQVT